MYVCLSKFACTDLLWFVCFCFFFDLQLVRWCIWGSVMLRCWQEQALYNAPLNDCQHRTLLRNSPLYASRLHLREWQWRTMNKSKIGYHFLTIPNTSVRFVLFHEIPPLLTTYHSITCVWFFIIPPPQTACYNALSVIITICCIHHTYLTFPTT